MLQSMGLQRAGHDLAAEQPQEQRPGQEKRERVYSTLLLTDEGDIRDLLTPSPFIMRRTSLL